jgi:hypothetical protein
VKAPILRLDCEEALRTALEKTRAHFGDVMPRGELLEVLDVSLRAALAYFVVLSRQETERLEVLAEILQRSIYLHERGRTKPALGIVLDYASLIVARMVLTDRIDVEGTLLRERSNVSYH